MSLDRRIAFRRVLQRYRQAGLTDPQIAEAVHALRDGTTPGELSEVLNGYLIHGDRA